MKDNTLAYLAIGAVILYAWNKKRTPNVVPTGYTTYPGTTIPSSSSQGSQSVVLPLISSVASIVQNILKNNQSQQNVSEGYNADGSIPLSNTTQDSINQLNNGGLLNTLTIPVLSTNTSSPDGIDTAMNTTDYTWNDFMMI